MSSPLGENAVAAGPVELLGCVVNRAPCQEQRGNIVVTVLSPLLPPNPRHEIARMQRGLAPGTLPTRMSARNPKQSLANFARRLSLG